METESNGGETGGKTRLGGSSSGNPRGGVATDFEKVIGTENRLSHRQLDVFVVSSIAEEGPQALQTTCLPPIGLPSLPFEDQLKAPSQ